MLFKKRIKSLPSSSTQSPQNIAIQTVSYQERLKPLDERELGLVSIIYKNAESNKTTSMEEVDKILGMQNKPIDIQKKHRSDVSKSINTKLSIVANTNEAIIDRIRNEDDKRSFSYKINEQYKHLVAQLL